MLKFKGVLLCSALAIGLAGNVTAQTAETAEATPMAEVSSDTVLATVGETKITLGHLIAAIEDLDGDERNLPNQVLLDGMTERLIQQAAIAETAPELSQATQLRLENERQALIAGERVGQAAAEIDVSDEELKAAYDAQFAEFTPATEYNAAHILVATEDEAKALVTELEGGADFAELAKEKSTGPSGPGGGDLGWFQKGQMVAPFQEAVETLEPGGVSTPVQTQFGWHVIKLIETRIPEVPTLESMTAQLQQDVFRQKLSAIVDEMIGGAEVVRMDLGGIDADLVRDGSLIGR